MKKGAIFSVFILLSFLSYAQIERKVTPAKQADSSFNRQEQPGEMDRKDMMRELHLTKEQKGKMKELHQSGKSRREAIFNDDKLTKEEKQTQLRTLQKEQLQGTMNILNEEQRQELQRMRSEMRTGKQKKQDKAT